ncbi:MAG: hypothetical protein FWF54_03640 [Candidatus Azobacteroides sp.]|nr:hypothetical protein [Candidatus Azobacteroides sp.]
MKEEKRISNISCRCIDITLDEFMDCVCNGNFSRIVRGGNPSDGEISEAWSELYAEYSELSRNMRYQYIFNLSREIYMLSAKLELVGRILLLPKDNMTAHLKLLKYNGTPKNIKAEIKRQSLVLSEKEKELSGINRKDGGKMTERDFIKWIVPVSRFMNQRIDKKTTSLLEFLEMNREMEEYYEHLNRK